MSQAPESPAGLAMGPEADVTPEDRGLRRDGVRLLVSGPSSDRDRRFVDLATDLRSGDLLVVNESRTLPASLPAFGAPGPFRLNLSTRYSARTWLAEPRWDRSRPGPVALHEGEAFRVGAALVRWVSVYPGVPRLGFVRFDRDVESLIGSLGSPIRYGYLRRAYPLKEYQTVFARVPGSVEMPSAGRPFSRDLLRRLFEGGVRLAPLVLHAGVSSLERGDAGPGALPVYPEPFEVPPETIRAIEDTHRRGGRVVAVGTTVVRALESCRDGSGLRARQGFTRKVVAGAPVSDSVDGLITGFHTSSASHIDLLLALTGPETLTRAYAYAARSGYLWHEFGDSHLVWRGELPRVAG